MGQGFTSRASGSREQDRRWGQRVGNKSRGAGSGEKGPSAVSIVGCRSMQWGDEPELECSLDSWPRTSKRGPVHAPWYSAVKPLSEARNLSVSRRIPGALGWWRIYRLE